MSATALLSVRDLRKHFAVKGGILSRTIDRVHAVDGVRFDIGVGENLDVVAMSGYGQPEDVRAAEAAGFDRHLTKPLDPRRLSAALREMGVGS